MPVPPRPDGDERWLPVAAAMRRHQNRPSALIEVLRVAQDAYGYLDTAMLHCVARGLRLPPSRVYGVASFYHLFALAPPGEHACDVCLGTACYVKGGGRLLDAVRRQIGTDSRVTVTTSRCVGACGMAPLAAFDGAVAGPLTANEAGDRVKGWLAVESR